MLLSEEKLHKYAGPGSWERGIKYYLAGKVKLQTLKKDEIYAYVRGSYRYEVSFYKRGDGWIASCDCPYNYGGSCKHVIATGLAANAQYKKVEEANERVKQQQKMQGTLFDKFGMGKAREQQESQKDKQLVFNFYQDNLRWQINPAARYIKKNGQLGRESSVSFYQLAEGNVKASSMEKIAFRYLDGAHFSQGYFQGQELRYEQGTDMGHILKMLKQSIVYDFLDGKEVKFYPKALSLKFTLKAQANKGTKKTYVLSAALFDEGNQYGAFDTSYSLLTAGYIFLLKDHTIFELSNKISKRFILPFISEGEIVFSKKELDGFMQYLYPELCKNENVVILPDELKINVCEELTGKKLFLSEKDGLLEIDLKFEYNNKYDVNYLDKKTSVTSDGEGSFLQIKRQNSVEGYWVKEVKEFSLSELDGRFALIGKRDPIDWLFEDLPKIAAKGFKIFGEESLDQLKVRRATPKIISNVSSGTDWFDLEMALDFDGLRVSVEEVLKSVKKNKKYFRLDNGYVVQIDDSILKRIGLTKAFGAKVKGKEKVYRFSKNQLMALEQILDGSDSAKTDEAFKNRLRKLKSFKEIKNAKMPDSFKGQLRDYQKAGYDWLHFLNGYGFGGCLADDMGLGKTAQALAFIEKIKTKAKGRPFLIVAPTSVIYNWEREIEKFTPALGYYLHYGAERSDKPANLKEKEIVLTSYPLLWRDYELLSKINFYYIILDESQKIKNPLSLTAKSAFRLKSGYRLVLTGTPIENNLSELWSQFNFLNPGMLGPLKTFQDYFSRAIERDGDKDKAEKLKKLIYPFILRRKKEDVVKELPPKIETVTYCEMDIKQEKVYNKWRDYYRAAILDQIEEVGLNKSKMKVLEGLTRLRQISIHPAMVESNNGKMTSGKFEALKESLEEIISEGHKILVFSQFVKALTLVREHLDASNIDYAYLDGRTKKRAEQVDKFQQDKACKIFLISLKAGGTGLNLTEAEYVIHLDPWWNPAVEMQASERAHRIGQLKQVFVYKMITKGSVEEKILLLQEKKKKLVENIISTDAAFFKNLKKEDIEGLFS